MTSPTIYDIGTVTLTNGSAEVSGDGTAWAINGVVGGVFSCDGMSVPIVSVDDDDTLTLAYPWPGSNASDAAYAISLINSQAADTIWANRHWSRVVGQALLAAIRPDASGTLAERDALNPMLDNGQWFARAEPPHDLEFYRKVPGGWEGPFTTRGVGGVGEGGLGIPSPGAADKMPYYSDADTISLTDLTPFARTLLDDTDAAAARATLGVDEGGLGLPSPGAAGLIPYYSGANTVALADAATFRDLIGVRNVLSATVTLYVRTDGNNNNDGLTNTSGGALATIQGAFDRINATDLRHYNVIIKLGNTGNFAGGTLNGPFLGSGNVVLEGDTGTPANTTVTSAITVSNGARLTIRYFRLAGATLSASLGGTVTMGSGMNFGATSGIHIHVLTGGILQALYGSVNYTISGGATAHIQMDAGAVANMRNGTITLTGTPAWAFAYCVMTSLSVFYNDAITFVGSATGTRYYVAHNSVCLTGGGGASYFPGSGGGSTPNGGLYL